MDNNSGTGIGLSLVQSLTQLHKGSLQLAFSDSKMNIFELTVPLHQEEEFMLYDETTKVAENNDIEIIEHEIRSKETTILVVEDNKIFRLHSQRIMPFVVLKPNGEVALNNNENVAL
jgi:K+-sensing histidine kinase KdpD